MKKFVCIVLSLLTVLALLAGCSKPHTHTYSNLWSTSETHHWHRAICEHTEERRDEQPHTFEDGKCTVCGYREGDEPQPIPSPEPSDNPFGDGADSGSEDFYEDYSAEERQLYNELWQETTTVRVDIDISAHELQKLNEAYLYRREHNGDNTLADVYRKCNLTITVNGTPYTFEEVGIRMRGNTSRTDFVDENGNIYNLVHFRFNLTETFDGDEYEGNAWAAELHHDWQRDTEAGAAARKQRKNRTFATMEKFYYKWNKCYDQTYIREVYANRMFRANGILAPHITLCQVAIKQSGNMESIGVGNLYELIDKQFIKRNFSPEQAGGDLYKCTYSAKGPADLTAVTAANCGIETATESFSYDLKTNDDPEDFNNHRYLKALVQALSAGKNSNGFETTLESMVDMDYFVRFEAVNYLLGNPDCIRNHANNYYLYFTPEDSNGKFTAYIIPYDYDRCLGVNVDWNPAQSMVNMELHTTKGTEMDCNNPLYRKTVLDGGISKYRTMLNDAVNMVLSGKWFTYDNFRTLFEAYKQHYETLARPSQLIVNQCSGKLNIGAFTFSDGGTQDINSSDVNLSVSYYMALKRDTALKGLAD